MSNSESIRASSTLKGPTSTCKTPVPLTGTGVSVPRYGCFSPFRTFSRSSYSSLVMSPLANLFLRMSRASSGLSLHHVATVMHAVHAMHTMHPATHSMPSPRHHPDDPDDQGNEEQPGTAGPSTYARRPTCIPTSVTTVSRKSHHGYHFSFPRGAFASLYV